MADIDTIYAWTTVTNGEEGVIAAGSPLVPGTIVSLHHRRRAIAETFKPIAEAHGKRFGERVRFVEFVRARTLEDLPP